MKLTFSINYKVSEGLSLSPSELVSLYFFGIDLCDPNGNILSDQVLESKIKESQAMIERTLNIKLGKQIIQERTDYNREEWKSFGYVGVSYPVNKPFKLEGFLNNVKQISYPKNWLTSRKDTEKRHFRHVFVLPNGVGSGSDDDNLKSTYSGVIPYVGILAFSHIPNYWDCVYCSGYDKIPSEIIDLIGKLAAMQIFSILGDILLGAGIASQSLSLDGLSESISTTQSAENSAFSARIKQYATEIKHDLPHLEGYYKGIEFESM